MTDARAPGLDPDLFGDGPARDARFDVKELWQDMANYPDETPEYKREFLHRQMNEEVNVLECAARSLVDFPEADWKLRKSLARQCADEARHARLYLRLLARRGIEVGEYPIINFQYRILGKIDTLIGRLTVENRTFEADGLDAVSTGIERERERGDHDLADLFETQQADEILHDGFANAYIQQQVRENPARALQVARAVGRAGTALEQVGKGGALGVHKYPVAEAERLEAGFGAEEVRVAAELSRRRREAAVELRGRELAKTVSDPAE
jgi:uncharacterized ferritin-like protein (DUF455 family)